MRSFAFASFLLVSACVVEPPSPTPPSSESPDAATARPGPDGGSGTAACIAPAPSPGDGHHNAGLQCLSCHTGNGAPKWYAAGTLYTDTSGSSPVTGATITITDANGTSVHVVTADNGNFWTPTPLTAPLHVKASECPSSKQMSGTAAGACNGCHAAGGSPGRIHL